MKTKTRAQIFSDNLRRIRLEKGVSRAQLAAVVGITEIAFGRYERGVAEPAFEKIFAIADFLQVSVASLMGENKFADNIPDVDKLVEEKFFERRLQRAYQMARDFLDYELNAEPHFDKNNRIVIHSPKKIKYENGVVSVYGGYNSVAFKSKLDFVEVMEKSETIALQRGVFFNQAFRGIVFDEQTYRVLDE